MKINCGIAMILGPRPDSRRGSEIDPTAVVRNCDFGRYTYLGARSLMADSVLADYGYAMGDNHIAHADIGKFCNIAIGVRINPSNHPWWRASLHHFTYRSTSTVSNCRR